MERGERSPEAGPPAAPDTDEALRRFELLWANSRDIILFLRQDDGRILEANAAAVKAYGHSREELLAMAIQDLRAPEAQGRSAEQMGLADDRGILFETVHRRRDGSPFPVEVSWRSATAGGTRTLVGVVRDITERRRTEALASAVERRHAYLVVLGDALRPLSDPAEVQREATRVLGQHLRASRVHYAEVVEQGAFGIVRADYSDGLPSVVGRHRFDAYGATVMDEFRAGRTLVVRDVLRDPRLGTAEREATAALKVGAYVIVPLVKAGAAVAVLVAHQSEPRPWSEEEVSLIEETAERTWAAVERAHAELALRQSTQRLEARERQLRTLVENVTVGVALVEATGRFTLYNRRFLDLFGLAPSSTLADVNAQDWAAWRVVDEARQPLDVEEHPVRRAVRTGLPVREQLVGVLRPGAQDLTWMLVSAAMVPSEGGAQTICTYQDITAQREAEDALREADRRKSEFLAVLSHELRNPLTPILNSIELLELEAAGGDRSRRAREVLRRQTEHLRRLVDDLLDVTRISHGKFELERVPLDARAVVARACDDARSAFERRQVELRLEPGAGAVWVHADELRVAQMVGNLINNALKFTPRGGRVQVSVDAGGGTCRIVVRDSGEGIEPSELARIFEPFVQAAGSRSSPNQGLGLGLALVHGLAALHGGTVQAQSAGRGQGAEFTLTLPLAPGAPAAEVPGARVAAAGLSVVVVDDNEDAGATLAEVLTLRGHRVRVETTGQAGVEAVLATAPDVLLCDISLPDMTGYEVVRAVRAAPAARPLVAIAITGHAQPDDLRRAREAGFDAHLAKPMSLAELDSLLASRAPSPR